MMNPGNVHLFVADDAVDNTKVAFYQFPNAGILKFRYLSP